MSQITLSRYQLFEFLEKHFNLEELRTLCFFLDEDSDNLSASSKHGFIRELILRKERLGEYQSLVDAVVEFRPVIFETSKGSTQVSNIPLILDEKQEELDTARKNYLTCMKRYEEIDVEASMFEQDWHNAFRIEYELKTYRDNLTSEIRSKRSTLKNIQKELDELTGERKEINQSLAKARSDSEKAQGSFVPYKDERNLAEQELQQSIRKLRQIEIEYQIAGGRLSSVSESEDNPNIFKRLIEYIKLYLGYGSQKSESS